MSAAAPWIPFVLTDLGAMLPLQFTPDCRGLCWTHHALVPTRTLAASTQAAWTLSARESHVPRRRAVARLFQGQPWAEPSASLRHGAKGRCAANGKPAEPRRAGVFVVKAAVRRVLWGSQAGHSVLRGFTSWFAQPARGEDSEDKQQI